MVACQDDATHFVSLCLQVCMQRAWSMSSLSSLQPNCWSGICDENLDRARNCKKQIESDCKLVENVFQKIMDRDPNVDVKAS